MRPQTAWQGEEEREQVVRRSLKGTVSDDHMQGTKADKNGFLFSKHFELSYCVLHFLDAFCLHIRTGLKHTASVKIDRKRFSFRLVFLSECVIS